MNKLALIIALNYNNTNLELSGCYNDAEAFLEMIHNGFNYKKENIILITDSKTYFSNNKNILQKNIYKTGNKNQILNVFDIFSKKLKDESYNEFIITYSGHGIQIKNETASDENDNRNEAIVPSNNTNKITNDLLIYDNIINEKIIKPLNDKDIRGYIFMDACNSGSNSDLQYQYIYDFNKFYRYSNEDNSKPKSKIISISSSLDKEVSLETRYNGRTYGVLTQSIYSTYLNKGSYYFSNLNIIDLYKMIYDKMKNYLHLNQTPVLSTNNADIKTLVFNKVLDTPLIEIIKQRDAKINSLDNTIKVLNKRILALEEEKENLKSKINILENDIKNPSLDDYSINKNISNLLFYIYDFF